MPWARRISKPIPATGSRTETLELNEYSKGFNTFTSNDKFPVKNGGSNLWRLAQDARIITLGDYETRKGVDYYSAAAGETIDVQQTSTTSAGEQDISQTVRIAKKITFTTTGRCTRLDVNLKNDLSATGTVLIELWSDGSGAPGARLGRTSIAASEIGSSFAYEIGRLISAPSVTATDFWCVVYVQATGTNSYTVSTTTNATTGLVSTDSGMTWSAASVDFNVKAYLSTDGGSRGVFRATKSDGTKVTLLVQGTTLYSVNDVTGALTSVKTGLSASATDYRFCVVNDICYYVNGFDGLRKLTGSSFGTDAQVNSTNYTHITEHKGLLMLVRKDDPTRIDFSNFADYETFTSTDFIYVPSPKTGDPVTALIPLNGALQIKTLNNAYILSGSDNATFVLDQAPDKNGTYRQETSCSDKNSMYYLSNDGVFRSNGSEAQLLSSDVYNDIKSMPNKDDAVMAINKGRLYLWYTPSGEASNSKCYVFSLNFGDDGGTTESLDTGAYIGRAFSSFRDDNEFIVASSRVGQVFWQELESNDYTNLGDDINYMLQTHYFTGSSPAVLKQNRYWEPRFGAQSGNYTITAEYAYDLRNNWQTNSAPSVQGSGETYGGGAEYADGSVYGSSAETQAQLYIPGEYRRVAVRYRHYATRQPNNFLGHTFVNQTRRIR